MPRPLIHLYAPEVQAEAKRALLRLSKTDARRAIVRAGNKALTGMRTDVVRHIREEYEVKAAEIRKRMEIVRFRPNRLRGWVTVRGRLAVPLFYYGARPAKPVSEGGRRPKKGISVKVKKSSGRTVIPGTFVQRTPRLGPTIMRRVGDTGRLPVRILYGPSYLPMLQTFESMEQLNTQVVARFAKNLDHEAGFLLAKEKGVL